MDMGRNELSVAENKGLPGNNDPHVLEVVRQAHEELRQLMRQRAEIMKRIGTVKQTIVGLANLVESGVLPAELLELGRLPRGLGVGQLSGDLLRPCERLAESGLHALPCGLLRPVFLAEALHPPGRVHQLLPAGEVRVALGADLDVNHGHRGARHEAVAAGALHGRSVVGRVNSGFHCTRSLTGSRTARSVEI